VKRLPLRRGAPVRSGAALRRTTRLKSGPPPVRRTPLARSGRLGASPAQRARVGNRRCLVCRATAQIDPAHVIPRSLGGCDEPDCVIALCRSCHRAYDGGTLDLLRHLEPHRRVELAHAVWHVGLLGALRRITGQRNRHE
jgi:5-methylcytosine-specific restriction endonuclease McrA